MRHRHSQELKSGLNLLTVVRYVCFFFHTITIQTEYVFFSKKTKTKLITIKKSASAGPK